MCGFVQRLARLVRDFGLQTVQGVLSIALYGCLSKFTTTGQQQAGGPTGFRWLPSLSRSRPPMAISAALVAGCVALTLSPLGQVFHCMVCQPAIELFHSSSGLPKTSNDNKANNETPDAPSATNQEIPAPSTKPVPSAETHSQISIGASLGPILEAAVPGSVTIVLPLCEEVFFRGLLFARLVPSIGCFSAALGSSLEFGGTHRGEGGSTYIPLSETILGFACSLLYFRTGRLLVPFALHSGVNSCFVLVRALQSAPHTAAQRWLASTKAKEDEYPATLPDFSFW